MNSASLASPPAPSVSLWRDCIAPKEHGSWSLAFEPIALSLLVAPSVPGALLALALAGGFFARRPLRMAWSERRAERRLAARRACCICLSSAALAFAGVVALGGVEWTAWLAPVAIFGCVFAVYDTQGGGREEVAEVAGSAAFALTPAAFAILGGWGPASAAALALLMLARSVPSVLYVRAFLRAAKTGVRRDLPALLTSAVALGAAVFLYDRGIAPLFAVVAMIVFLLRAVAVLLAFRPKWRASRIGMIEAMLGVSFVAGLAATWRG